MSGDRCHRQEKMMGRGADGGCGTEERSCPISRVPARFPAEEPEIPEKTTSVSVDFFTQAHKALSELSPFDVPDEATASASASTSTVLTLPSGLAKFLARSSHSRRKHKKSHSGADKKSSRQGEKSRGYNIWGETEEYFRDLTKLDIEALSEVSSLSAICENMFFIIPVLGSGRSSNAGSRVNVIINGGNENDVLVEEEVEKEDELPLETDMGEAETLPQEDDMICSVSDISHGLEWLLGCRNKVSLTSERPSKKQKLLGSDAGLDKVVTLPCEGNSSQCHFCSKGRDMVGESNSLVVCRNCKVEVHQKCYGVVEEITGSWLCNWCRQVDDDSKDSLKPCVLCPKQGGALKPVHKNVKNEGSVEFAHLFCSQWMPEVYIEDLKQMEPIMNVEGIKETRRKLVCNVCKVKCGACVRCSHGTCRTAFHPICAREARHRMEVWGRYGSDNVELRAFCSKHSEVVDCSTDPKLQDHSESIVGESCVVNPLPVTLSINRPHKLVIGLRNGDDIALPVETPDPDSNKLADDVLKEVGLAHSRLDARQVAKFDDSQNSTAMGTSQKGDEDVSSSDSLKFAPILKKLIDRGKVNVKDVASQIGLSPDTLISKLAGDNVMPDLGHKIVKWLKAHAHIGNQQKNLRVKIKSAVLSKDDGGATVGSDKVGPGDVRSIPPRRRTKNDIRDFKYNEVTCSSEEALGNEEMVLEKQREDKLDDEEPESSSKESVPGNNEKHSSEQNGLQDSLQGLLSNREGSPVKLSNGSPSKGDQLEEVGISDLSNLNADHEDCAYSVANPAVPDLTKAGASSSSYIHPYIQNQFLQMRSGTENSIAEANGCTDGVMSRVVESSKTSVCCIHENQHSECSDREGKSDCTNLDQLVRARRMGVLELHPEDEVEGELIYYQQRLLANAVARKQFTDNLIHNVSKSLPKEVDGTRSQRWNAVLVNRYLSELREAKKRGKKERRHKEAQAVLAAATAAAAASSRISSLRKDIFDESVNPESLSKLNTSNGRAGICSQLMPRPKETLPKVAPLKISVEKHSESVPSVSDFCKEQPRSCDICRRSETSLNPILVCSSCKVAVHLECYRTVKESSGPWHCELCEELSTSKSAGVPAVNFWDKPYFVAECGLCGGSTGAFRKSSDGQWVHAFCAEWVFESTFRRGQSNSVEGMETVSKGVDVCHICRRSHGVCIKCNYGHCQSAFHASCARSAGFYMNTRISGGRLQHKAYCEKHSSEQRAKAENQTHGIEELKRIKQIRVELERLRLLCERVIRREKLKRELVLSSQDILAFKRDHVARLALSRSPFLLPEISSESATTSLKGGATDDIKSCSEAVQRSDDTTVDSSISAKHRTKSRTSMETNQKIGDDDSTSQNPHSKNLAERVQFSGKQLPHRPVVPSRNLVDDGGWKIKSRKHAETFQRELVMTSDQASMKNSLLPKQYLYVPADVLVEEKQQQQIKNPDAGPGEPIDGDG